MLYLIFLLGFLADAQTLTYTQLPSGATAPSPRLDGTIAYDQLADRSFCLAGRIRRFAMTFGSIRLIRINGERYSQRAQFLLRDWGTR